MDLRDRFQEQSDGLTIVLFALLLATLIFFR